jgi:hypothetical protein
MRIVIAFLLMPSPVIIIIIIFIFNFFSIIREFSRACLPFGDFLAVCTNHSRTLGDLFAGTRVVLAVDPMSR